MENETQEEMIERHRQEKKLLQAKIQSLKHAIPKGDKKRKKEVTTEIELLETELKDRHANELKRTIATNGDDKEETIGEVVADVSALSLETADDAVGSGGRVTKAQKRRDKKAQEAKERLERIENEDVSELSFAKNLEAEKLNNILKARGLVIVDIPSDGDCMYKALEHQLSLHGETTSVDELRQKTSKHIRNHRDDFIPFLVNEQTGDLMTNEEFATYCDAISKTKVWGGQIELQALGAILNYDIEVLQAEGRNSVVTNESATSNGKKKLLLSYHRHAYRLGEHYNSVVQKP